MTQKRPLTLVALHRPQHLAIVEHVLGPYTAAASK